MSKPLIRIKCAEKNWDVVVDLVDEIRSGKLLGMAPNSRYVEKLNGADFEIFRLRNGGFDIRDYRDDGVNARTYEFRPECARNVERRDD